MPVDAIVDIPQFVEAEIGRWVEDLSRTVWNCVSPPENNGSRYFRRDDGDTADFGSVPLRLHAGHVPPADQSLGTAVGIFAARWRMGIGCATIVPQARKGNTGGGSGTDCVSDYQDCYVGCGVDYPEGSDNRTICESNCDNVYERCKLRGSISGLGGILF